MTLLLAGPAAAAAAQAPMAHDRLDRAMFWAGALVALTPVVIGLTVAGIVIWHRRRQQRPPAEGRPAAPAS